MSRKKDLTTDKLEENLYKNENFLEPTPGLNTREIQIWDHLVKSMQPGFFIDSDRLLIGEYIKLQQISDLAYKELHDVDSFIVVQDSGAQMGNKLIDIIVKTSSAMGTISQKLGVCPSARQRHEKKVNGTTTVIDEIESLLD